MTQRRAAATRRAAGRRSRLRRATSGDRPYVLALLALVALLAAMAVGPLQSFTAAAERVDDLGRSHDQLRTEVERLEDRRVRLHEPDEVELLAREQLGMVRPGEIPFVVVTGEQEFATPAQATGDGGDGAGDGRPWYARLWDAFAGLFDER